MVIKRLGAQRFSGLESDVSSLPIDADLVGAIFNSTDTLKFFIFNGTVWNESAGGGGGITGLNPNSTILEYLNNVPTVFTDYTTPTSATATSGTPANAIDVNTTTFWQSNAGINESITLDMGSAVNAYGLAYFLSTDAGMTETEFQIKSISGEAPTFFDDFTTYTSQGEADLAWVPNDSAVMRVNITTDELDFVGLRSGTNDSIARNMGTTLSGTQFITRFEVDITAIDNAGSGFGKVPLIGLSNLDESSSDATLQDSIFIGFQNSGVGALQTIIVGFSENAAMTANNKQMAGTATFTIQLYFCEIIRDGVTITYNIYSDVNFSSLLFTDTHTIIGSLNTLNHFVIRNQNAGASVQAGSVTGTLDEVTLFADRTTIPTVVSDQLLRTINVSDMTLDAWNFIRFNGVNAQQLVIEGSSGSSLVMAANELVVQLEPDPPLTTKHGQFTIVGTNASLPLNGGDPTTSVIDDPIVNTITLNNVATPNDPAAGKGVLWVETVDADNDGIFAKIKVAGSFKTVRIL